MDHDREDASDEMRRGWSQEGRVRSGKRWRRRRQKRSDGRNR